MYNNPDTALVGPYNIDITYATVSVYSNQHHSVLRTSYPVPHNSTMEHQTKSCRSKDQPHIITQAGDRKPKALKKPRDSHKNP
ncbi:hypothetical protein N7463_006970 [Penicillium fimorum]|uniref:Uncharacterized protein n=1 Tax=Penicillium fimorum TaxID=1882269 RepID=A0A9X0C739_9EURO|nr:hypothetical protein N7463_006970 [Penicillium fimorum]